MENPWLHAYVDETGTNDLDTSKAGVSAYFICVAVVVDEDRVEELTGRLDGIAQRLCSGAEIKSSSIGGNHQRRNRFLEEIKSLDFGYYAMLIRKDAVWNDSGLQHKRSFYKFINKMLYGRLTRSSKSIRIFADQVGGQDFMDSFKSYLKVSLKPDLFFDFDHQFADSKGTRLIQLADLIAGTLAQCFEPSKRGLQSGGFRMQLRPKELAIDVWPEDYTIPQSEDQAESGWDELSQVLIGRVQRYLREHEQSEDPTQRMRVSVLRRLLFARGFEQADQQTIFKSVLMKFLKDQGFGEISDRFFMKEVIGSLRMEGIIIAGTSKGLKLALNFSDIRDYLNHDKSIIEPMLARLREARKAVKLDTANTIDIVGDGPYRLLGHLVDCLGEEQLVLEEVES